VTPGVGPWEKGQTQRYRRRVEREKLVLDTELPFAVDAQLARCPELVQKVPEMILKELTWTVFVGVRERRFVRVPVYTQKYKLSVAAGKTVAYFAQGISPCKMTKEHRNELGPGTESLCVSLGTMFRYQFFKVRTRNFRENLTEQA
jgi:hypothetical protein